MRSKKDCIGISKKRLNHILGVARKAYALAIKMGYGETFAQKCFMMGWIHDIGYEFVQKPEDHSAESKKLFDLIDDLALKAVEQHGYNPSFLSEEYKILNMADMTVDENGKNVDVIQRLEVLKEKYGEHSDKYLTACDVCFRIGLTSVNLAGNIT